MANSLLTIDMITREAVELFKNSNAFLMSIDRQYDDQFARSGAKIGSTLRIRLPNDYTVTDGPALAAQDTSETSTTLTVATQKHVDIAFTTAERTMKLDDYSDRILKPAINALCGSIAADIMNDIEGNICNYTSNTAGGATISPTASNWLTANAILDLNSAPMGDRMAVLDPLTDARTVASLSGLFNPSQRISTQFQTGQMRNALGFDWARDQTVIKHASGAYASNSTVSAADQTGSSVSVTALGAALAKGDIVTFAGSYAVNRVTKVSTGQLRQFVVTAAAAINATSVSVYPAIVAGTALYDSTTGNGSAPYQTVTASPTNGGTMTLVNVASETYRKNFVYSPKAVTMVFADLEMPKGVHEVARVSDDSVSMRVLTDYIPTSDQMITRVDVLYGKKWLRGEWGCIVADSLT